MKQLLILATLFTSICLLNRNLQAQQTCANQWAYKLEASLSGITTPTDDAFEISDIKTDNAGNVYTTGYFKGYVDFNPSAITNSLNSPDHFSCFLMKSDSSGNFSWVKEISGTSTTDDCRGYNIGFDASQNIYLVGSFLGTIDANPSASISNITSVNSYTLDNHEIFILKLNTSGNFLWVKHFEANIREASIDETGNTYITGLFKNTVDLDAGAGVSSWANMVGNSSCFVVKYNSSGSFVWGSAIGENSYSVGSHICFDAAHNVILTGVFTQTVDFNTSAASIFNLTGTSMGSMFIWKLNSAGNFVWAKKIDETGSYDCNADNAGNIYIVGSFEYTVDFDPGIATYNLYSAPYYGGYILKLTSAGNFSWVRGLTYPNPALPNGYVTANTINITNNGDLIIKGSVDANLDFDPGVGTHFENINLAGYGPNYTYLLKLDSLGIFKGVNVLDFYQLYNSVFTIDNNSTILISGFVHPTGSEINHISLMPTNNYDASFVAKLKFLEPPKSTNAGATLSTCSGNATTLTASGVGTLGWYSAATGGTYLGGGNTFTTPILTSNTTYYVQDSICDPSDRTPITVAINTNTLPSVNVSASNSAFCKGLSTDLTATGTNTYTWMPGNLTGSTVNVSPAITTTYTVTGTNLFTGCYNTSTKVITVYQPPTTLSISSPSSAVCNGESITLSKLSSGAAVTNYVWSTGAVNTPITVTPASTSTYTVTASTSNGCSKTATKTITMNPCSLAYTVKLFIEGYYTGGGFMQPVLLNQGVVGAVASRTDSIRLSLRNTADPYEPIFSWHTLVQTNGNILRNFPSSGTYYISVLHRNGIETWSKNPVSISAFAPSYNFTTSANKAYGDNMVEVESGKWAIYSGDVNGDRNVDLLDLSEVETDINNFQYGYFVTDINGDGNVDLLDNPLLEANINAFVFSMHP